MTQSSVSYERLVAELHQALINADGVTTIKVEHNVVITGKSGATHQIDVYWEFTLGGVIYRTCIECKQFNSKVKKSHVAAFAAIIEDIGNATGIFATTGGYQAGALLLAEHKNIRLLLVNPLLQAVHLKMAFNIPEVFVTDMELEQSFLDCMREQYGKGAKISHHIVGGHEPIFDSNGLFRMTFAELLQATGSHKEGAHTIEVSNAYIKADLGLMPLRSISYTIKHRTIETEDIIRMEGTAKAILEDVLGNTSCYVHSDGAISAKARRRNPMPSPS